MSNDIINTIINICIIIVNVLLQFNILQLKGRNILIIASNLCLKILDIIVNLLIQSSNFSNSRISLKLQLVTDTNLFKHIIRKHSIILNIMFSLQKLILPKQILSSLNLSIGPFVILLCFSRNIPLNIIQQINDINRFNISTHNIVSTNIHMLHALN